MEKKRIIILDSTPSLSKSRTSLFEKTSYSVSSYITASEAEDHLKSDSEQIDLFMVSLSEDGQFDAIQVIKDVFYRYPHLPIMLQISSDETEIPKEARSLPLSGIISKNASDPVFLTSINAAIRLGTVTQPVKSAKRVDSQVSDSGLLRFYQSMDEISRIMQKTDDLELMLEKVLESVLSIFDCDRSNLGYPCNPDAPSIRVIMEKSKPEYPGLQSRSKKYATTPAGRHLMQSCVDSTYPIKSGPTEGRELAVEEENGGYQSIMLMALRPTIGEPWMFTIHQCAYPRVWTAEDEKLFHEIGLRLEDGLSRLLFIRELTEKEKQLEHAQRLAHIGSWETDIETDQVKGSAEYCRIHGIDSEMLNNSHEWRKAWATMLDPVDLERIGELIETAKKTGQGYHTDFKITRLDGTTRDISVSAEVTKNASGHPQKIVGSIQDTTQRKETERILEKLNRELRALSDCNQALIRAEDEQTLFEQICGIICDEAGYRMAWIGLVSGEATKRIDPVAWAGVEDDFFNIFNLSKTQTEEKTGPIRTELWKGNTVCLQDLETYEGKLIWKEEALQRGYQSCIIIPLMDWNNQVFALISIYSVKKNTFVSEEIKLLEELAADLAYGVMSLRDRQKHKQTLEDLENGNELLNTIIKAAPVAIVGLDLQGNVQLVWNPAAEKMFGWRSEEVMGKLVPTAPVYDQDEFAYFLEFVRDSVFLNGTIIHRIKRDGSPVDLEVYSSPIRDSKGQLTGRISVFMDVTEKNRIEAALRESEERYRSMFKNSPLGIFRSTLEGIFLELNPALIDMLGYEPEDQELMTMERFSEKIYKAENERRKIFAEASDAKGTTRHQITYLRKDGSEFVANLYMRIIQDQNGQPAFCEGIIEDVTERKRNEELMIQTEKMTSLGGLAAGIAHEINNPLGAILMGAQNAKRRLSPEIEGNKQIAAELDLDLNTLQSYLSQRNVLSSLDGIRNAAQKAGDIITNMLQFSRKSESRWSYAHLNVVLDKSIELASKDYDLKKKIDFRKIKVLKEYDPKITTIQIPCVVTELEQVILNLLKNASQALSIGKTAEPCITIRLIREAPNVRIEIEDNGPGVEEYVKKRLFEPFFTTKPVGQGTGLGLSVSYMIITKNHGGTMEVESVATRGTRFIIRLPLFSKNGQEKEPPT